MFQEGVTVQFLKDILRGVHQPGDTYKIALYTKAAATDKNASLKTYNTTGELPTAGGYTRGGRVLSGFAVGVSGRIPYTDWTDAVWGNATFSADAAVIYNATRANKVLTVLDFHERVKSINGPFTIEFPAAVVIARGRTNALKMATRCENPAEPVAIYSGNGIWSFPRAATWHFLSDRIIIYPLGFVGKQTSFVLSYDYVFDDPESFHFQVGHSAPLGEHFEWLELDETNPLFFCSYERDAIGQAAITRADPRVISKKLRAEERRNRKAGG